MILRSWHTRLGQFIAPMMIYFGLTGAMQVFDLHESHDGYSAPMLLQKLGRLHKDQVFAAPPERNATADNEGDAVTPPAGRQPAHDANDDNAALATIVLKVLACFAALLFCSSAVLGIMIGLKQGRNRRLSLMLLAAGTAVPFLCVAIAAAAP
jgi:hypothetical protein